LTQASDDEKGRDALRKRDRAFCYIVHQEKIVLLKLIDYPHLALQIPGGTIEVNEEPADAALREAEEETGLESLKLVKLLGDDVCDMRQYGHQEIVHGWFYQFSVDGFEKGVGIPFTKCRLPMGVMPCLWIRSTPRVCRPSRLPARVFSLQPLRVVDSRRS